MIIKIKNEYRFFDGNDIKTIKKLPNKTYVMSEDTRGYFLKETDSLTIPSKLYGEKSEVKEEIIKVFESRSTQSKNTGVMLSGDQGTGKTVFIKDLAVSLLKKDYPVIIVNQCFSDEDFNETISKIKQPCVIIFDEFEKVYSREKDDDHKDPQASLLTLLDGTYQSNHLFIFACNNSNQVNDYFYNRPSRIYFDIQFSGLCEEDIKEYCDDHLVNMCYLDDFYKLHKVIRSFTFDILVEMVNYSNLLNKSPLEGLNWLNIDYEADRRYQINFKSRGKNYQAKYLVSHSVLTDDNITLDFSTAGDSSFSWYVTVSSDRVVIQKDGSLMITDIEKDNKIKENNITDVTLMLDRSQYNKIEDKIKKFIE